MAEQDGCIEHWAGNHFADMLAGTVAELAGVEARDEKVYKDTLAVTNKVQRRIVAVQAFTLEQQKLRGQQREFAEWKGEEGILPLIRASGHTLH